MPGTPSRLTDSLIKDVAARVEAGAQPQSVLIALGIPQRTASRWIALGRGEQLPDDQEPEGKYEELWLAIDEAQAKARSGAETAILADKDFRAKQAWLAAKFPNEWDSRYRTPDPGAELARTFAVLAALGTKGDPPAIEAGDCEIVEVEAANVEADRERG